MSLVLKLAERFLVICHIEENKTLREFTKISESGISSIEEIYELQNFGYDGFLIGENFMKSENPALAILNFMNELRGSK
mgnify:CR=1 FL=1